MMLGVAFSIVLYFQDSVHIILVLALRASSFVQQFTTI